MPKPQDGYLSWQYVCRKRCGSYELNHGVELAANFLASCKALLIAKAILNEHLTILSCLISKFTRGLDKPFDARFVEAMDEVCKDLMQEFGPAVVYTQSDEITLAWNPVDVEVGQEMIFGGRVQKLVSLLAGRASSKFALEMVGRLPEKALTGAVPSMDCRVWQFPTLRLAAACFLWREADASKNSVSMLASSHFSHGQLQGVSSKDRKEMLLAKGVDWAALEPRLKRGSFFFKRRVESVIAPERLAKIPIDKRPEGGRSMRAQIAREDLPPLSTVSNRVDVLFGGAVPVPMSEWVRLRDEAATPSASFGTSPKPGRA